MQSRRYVRRVALIVAFGGFLMGFDASVISGVVKFIESQFSLSKIQVGWAVSSLTLAATLAMMVSGPLSDAIGRKKVLLIAAVLYAVSAIASGLAPTYSSLVIARMLAGLGVGASLILAPMYIAEISPAKIRGRMVSYNQLNIVLGISAAFFSNYLILELGKSDAAWVQALKLGPYNWRWMLGLETLPAILYFLFLLIVPESPRWLVMKGRKDEALQIMQKASGHEEALKGIEEIEASIVSDAKRERVPFADLLAPALRLVLTIGIIVAVIQQITGINAVFFYAPMIFEQTGIGTNAAFSQAVLVGLINILFTILAMGLIDRLGRKPLLGFGLAGITISMALLAYGFHSATYVLTEDAMSNLPEAIPAEPLQPLQNVTYSSDVNFKHALQQALGADLAKQYESELISGAINANPRLILLGILGFVASFATSIGPVMWVLFSEIFPNRIRGVAISFVGFINSAVSFIVQLIFPWSLANLGSATTFFIFAAFAFIGLVLTMWLLPETKGRSLEELEAELIQG